MKYLLWVAVLVSGCTRPPKTAPTNALYAEVLPTRNGSAYYYRAVARLNVTPLVADDQARTWFSTSGRAIGAIEQKPIRRKSDLLYAASLPARRIPVDSTGEVLTLPPLRFYVTVDNTGDTTRAYATTFEVMDRRGTYQPLETHPVSAPPMWVSMWLGDVDAAVTTMLESLTQHVVQPANR